MAQEEQNNWRFEQEKGKNIDNVVNIIFNSRRSKTAPEALIVKDSLIIPRFEDKQKLMFSLFLNIFISLLLAYTISLPGMLSSCRYQRFLFNNKTFYCNIRFFPLIS